MNKEKENMMLWILGILVVAWVLSIYGVAYFKDGAMIVVMVLTTSLFIGWMVFLEYLVREEFDTIKMKKVGVIPYGER